QLKDDQRRRRHEILRETLRELTNTSPIWGSRQPEETEADKAKRELAERVLLSAQDASMQAARRAAEREGPLDPEYIYDEAFKAAEAAIEAAHVEGGRGCDDRRDPGAGREGGLAVGDLGGNEDGQPAGQPGRGELRGAAGGRLSC
ncbi:unnamed protein product, partial [Prorocentrum cordatum]